MTWNTKRGRRWRLQVCYEIDYLSIELERQKKRILAMEQERGVEKLLSEYATTVDQHSQLILCPPDIKIARRELWKKLQILLPEMATTSNPWTSISCLQKGWTLMRGGEVWKE